VEDRLFVFCWAVAPPESSPGPDIAAARSEGDSRVNQVITSVLSTAKVIIFVSVFCGAADRFSCGACLLLARGGREQKRGNNILPV
jgi:hypothetical protein